MIDLFEEEVERNKFNLLCNSIKFLSSLVIFSSTIA